MSKDNKVVFRQLDDVILRPMEESDVEFIQKWANDETVTEFLNLYLPLNENDQKDWVKNQRANGKEIVLLIQFSQDNACALPVGTIGLHGIDARNGTATLGILIGEKTHWGKGIGEKAITMILKYAFYFLNLRKVNLSVFSENERAKKLYKKCGFIVEGVRKENFYRNGKYVDEVCMAVFRKDWEDSQKKA